MNEWNQKVLDVIRASRDACEDRINAGIEQNRKGDLGIKFTDPSGAPLDHVQYKLRLKRHDFKFGCNLFMLHEMESEEKNAGYEQAFADLFNAAVLGLYWCDMEPVKGEYRFRADSPKIYRRPPMDLCVDWCREHGIIPKAHCLNYDKKYPQWLDIHDVPEIKRQLERWFADSAARYKNDIPDWEVTNETFFTDVKQTDFFFEDDLVEWSFQTAKKYLSGCSLGINEAQNFAWMQFIENRTNYYMQIQRSLQNGCKIDNIGMQFHLFGKRENMLHRVCEAYDTHRFLHILDRYSDFGLPISITEITIPAYSVSAEDEEVQAEGLSLLYRTWFSHPNMNAAYYWNLVDGYAAFAPQGSEEGENYYHGGLLRYDLSHKPSYDALYDLIHRQWHTEAEGIASKDGAEFRGFYGDYEVTAVAGTKTISTTVHFDREQNKQTIVL